MKGSEAKLKKLDGYLPAHQDVPSQSLVTTAKLGVVLDQWIQEYGINAYAIQCWSAMQDALKIFPCSIMSMMSNELLPSACEVDVMGAVAMYALQLAGGGASSLFDWNNNYGEGTDKLVVFHCSNTAHLVHADGQGRPQRDGPEGESGRVAVSARCTGRSNRAPSDSPASPPTTSREEWSATLARERSPRIPSTPSAPPAW